MFLKKTPFLQEMLAFTGLIIPGQILNSPQFTLSFFSILKPKNHQKILFDRAFKLSQII
jgi:hypothetical protein